MILLIIGGLILLVLGIGALQILLDKGQQDDWFSSPFIVFCALLSLVSLMLLVWVELRQKRPVVNLQLFRDISFSAGNLVMFMVGFGLYGAICIIPMQLQTMMAIALPIRSGPRARRSCDPFMHASCRNSHAQG